jgi:hypothetical protein
LSDHFSVDGFAPRQFSAAMRFCLVWMLGAALLAAGCRSSSEPRATVGKNAPAGASKSAKAEVVEPKARVRPVEAVRGRVVSVRDDLRFTIVDFLGGKMPVLDQQLIVYRLDQKVAEIKVSGPYRGTTVAADITAGEVKPGDLARDR